MKKLEVRLVHKPGVERVVGQLAESAHRSKRGQTFFEYDPAFLRNPLWLSPFKLPPQSGLIEHREHDFGPTFGLFDDSLPDGWGLLLMDRFFQQHGSVLSQISVLDRLAFLGTRTMGALTYHPPADPTSQAPTILSLQEMAQAAKRVLRGASQDVLPQLLRAGGSPGGARPKVLVGVRGNELISGEDDLPPGFAHWMVKFHAKDDPRDTGAIELAYSRMAKNSGIDMPPTRLFEAAPEEHYFGVERFDRHGNQRFHVHTFGNLVQVNFRIPSCDYKQLLEVTRVLTKNHQDIQECFRRMAFNVLTHNRDDHVKNFAFRMNRQGSWELAPAYDLVFASGPGGEHSMTIAGEGRAPTAKHMLQLAAAVDLSSRQAESILNEVVRAVEGWSDCAAEAGVSEDSARSVGVSIDSCLARV